MRERGIMTKQLFETFDKKRKRDLVAVLVQFRHNSHIKKVMLKVY